MAKKHYIQTPRGTAVLPFLSKEDEKYGGYKVSIRVDAETAAKFKAELLKGLTFKTKDFHIPIAEDDHNEGMFLIKTSSKFKPRVFDSRNNDLPSKLRVAGGSELAAYCEVSPYEVKKEEGVKLRLKEVQVFKFVEGSESHFAPVEDGFVYQGGDEDELIEADDL